MYTTLLFWFSVFYDLRRRHSRLGAHKHSSILEVDTKTVLDTHTYMVLHSYFKSVFIKH